MAWLSGGLLPEHKPIEEFLLWCVSRGLTPQVIRNYYCSLRAFFCWLDHEDMSYRDVAHEDLPRYFDWLRWRPLVDQTGPRRPVTTSAGVKNHRSALNMFYRFHGRRAPDRPLLDRIIRNEQSSSIITTQTLPYPHWVRHDHRHSSNDRESTDSRPVRAPRIVTDAQARALIEATTTSRDRFFMRLLDASGLRLGEALRLHHSDLDLRRGLVHVVHRPDPRGSYPSKKSRNRTVPVPKAIFDDYSDYMEQEYPADPPDARFVFLHFRAVHTPMRPHSVYIVTGALRRRTGIDFYTPHVSRRTFATRLLRAGVALSTVADLLGHAELETTHSWYGFLNAEDHRDQLRGAGLLPDDRPTSRPTAGAVNVTERRSVSPEEVLRFRSRPHQRRPRADSL